MHSLLQIDEKMTPQCSIKKYTSILTEQIEQIYDQSQMAYNLKIPEQLTVTVQHYFAGTFPFVQLLQQQHPNMLYSRMKPENMS